MLFLEKKKHSENVIFANKTLNSIISGKKPAQGWRRSLPPGGVHDGGPLSVARATQGATLGQVGSTERRGRRPGGEGTPCSRRRVPLLTVCWRVHRARHARRRRCTVPLWTVSLSLSGFRPCVARARADAPTSRHESWSLYTPSLYFVLLSWSRLCPP